MHSGTPLRHIATDIIHTRQTVMEISLVKKIVLLAWMIILGAIGFIKFIIGWIYMSDCRDMMLLPVYLVATGAISLVPPMLMAYRNMYRKQSPRGAVDGLWWLLAKLFFISLVLIVAGTIYILVSVTQVRVIGRLCSVSWLPPFGLATLFIDWINYAVFLSLFCNLDYKATPVSNEPLIPLYWRQRHRRHRY